MKKSICVVGLGYIGLPTAVMFAMNGHRVHGYDVNERAISMLQNKQLHIEEEGLQHRLEQAIDSGGLTVSAEPQKADVFILAVPSPINEDKTANLEYVRKASESIVPLVKKGDLVVLESTVPPRTVEDVVIPALEKSGLSIGEDILVSHSPERVIPGKVFQELVENDRIVGGLNEESSRQTVDLYRSFVKGTIHVTDATTAEMVKVMENTYRDVNIAFANELAKMAEQIGVNIWEAIKLANYHPRVNIHFPGPGVGGHCIAVDPWFLHELTPDLAKIIHLSRITNDSMPAYTADKVQTILKAKGIRHPRVTALGLAFKANIDDMRESPSVHVVQALKAQGMDVVSYDPHIKDNQLEGQTQDEAEAVTHADALVVLTDHKAFQQLDPVQLATLVRTKVIVDAKNCLEREKWETAGFEVYTLGDAKQSPQV